MNIPIRSLDGPMFLAELPEGFDNRTEIRYEENVFDDLEIEVIIKHPDFPPYRLNRQTKKFEKIV